MTIIMPSMADSNHWKVKQNKEDEKVLLTIFFFFSQLLNYGMRKKNQTSLHDQYEQGRRKKV